MLKISLFLITILVTSSCGGFKLFTPKAPEVDRKIASIMLNDDDQTFIEEVDEKLLSLHIYYVIGQKNLLEFDRSLSETKIEHLYQSKSYLHLMAVKTQTSHLESELSALFHKSGKKDLLKSRLEAFAKQNQLTTLSMENLREKLTGHTSPFKGKIQHQDLAKEYRDLEPMPQFAMLEKNVEHLSLRLTVKRSPSALADSLSAKSLPAKVWVVNFKTPYGKEKITPNLKMNQVKATFFETEQDDIDQSIRDAGTLWNIDALDWMAQSSDSIIKRTMALMKKTSNDSGVILFHAVHGRTVAAASEIIKHLGKGNRRTCTLSEIAEKVCLNN